MREDRQAGARLCLADGEKHAALPLRHHAAPLRDLPERTEPLLARVLDEHVGDPIGRGRDDLGRIGPLGVVAAARDDRHV